jgi:predicted RNase H-like nuclease (RuvC/YqgF family)
MKSFEEIMDEIIANMDKQRERAKIVAFVTDIAMMLRENGVIPCMSEVSTEIDDNDALKTLFCCRLEKLDFSEHDKEFEDKIADLQQRIRELIKEKDEYKRKCNNFGFENQELKQRIAELESENEKLFDYLSGITGNTRDEIKNNIENSKKISKKTIKTHIVIVGKEIEGKTYVKLEDFMSVVNDLQAEINT